MMCRTRGGYGSPRAVDGVGTPRPRRWPQRDTQPQRWSRGRQAVALRTRRRGWRPETRCNQRWTDARRGSRPNQRRCRRLTQRSERAEEGRSRGCRGGSEESAWQR
jgi:hypothetical protein